MTSEKLAAVGDSLSGQFRRFAELTLPVDFDASPYNGDYPKAIYIGADGTIDVQCVDDTGVTSNVAVIAGTYFLGVVKKITGGTATVYGCF